MPNATGIILQFPFRICLTHITCERKLITFFFPTAFQFDDFGEQGVPADISRYLMERSPDIGPYLQDEELDKDLFAMDDFDSFEGIQGAGGVDTSPPQYAPEFEAPAPGGHLAGVVDESFFTEQRSPPKAKDLNLSDTEKRYIVSAFGGDEETAKMVAELAEVVADIDQDAPDPYESLSPKMPALPTVDDGFGLYEEQFPDEYYMDFPPSPEVTPLYSQS